MTVMAEACTFAYEVVDTDGTVWGVGDTPAEAWEDARRSYVAIWNGDKATITDGDMDGLMVKPVW